MHIKGTSYFENAFTFYQENVSSPSHLNNVTNEGIHFSINDDPSIATLSAYIPTQLAISKLTLYIMRNTFTNQNLFSECLILAIEPIDPSNIESLRCRFICSIVCHFIPVPQINDQNSHPPPHSPFRDFNPHTLF